MKDHWQTAETLDIRMSGDATEGLNNPVGPLGVFPIPSIESTAGLNTDPGKPPHEGRRQRMALAEFGDGGLDDGGADAPRLICLSQSDKGNG